MKSLLTVTAAIEGVAGLALLCGPSEISMLLIGKPLEETAALLVARVGGSAILALTIACWLARRDENSLAAQGLIGGMLVYNVGVIVTMLFASCGMNLGGIALWPAVILHAAMTIWCMIRLREK